MNEDIITLQIAITRQEDDISRLSDELYTQQKEIAELRTYIQKVDNILGHLKQDENNIRQPNEETPPPHY